MQTQKLFTFLKKIKSNNNREWFEIHKKEYLECKKELEIFCKDLLPGLQLFDKTLRDAELKGYIFRIYRDARFAKGKPYKEHFGLLFLRGGKPNFHSFGGYYINIQSNNNFIVAGAYRPESAWLSAIRDGISKDSLELRRILKTLEKKNLSLQGEKLKTAPRGFSRDHKDIDLLRYKNFFVIHHFTNEEVLNKDFILNIASVCKKMYPLNEWLNGFVGK